MQEAEEQAIGWAIRLREPGAADWEGFTRWLESDPAHAAAYDRVALADADAAALLAAPRPKPILPRAAERAPPRRSRRAIGSAVAAALVASVSAGVLLTRGADTYAVVTAPGEQRSLTLGDGTQVALNGGSRLVLDRRDARRVELASGEASFSVVHNPQAPFEMVVGDAVLRDVGTRFDVRRRDAVTEVAVAEGQVLYNPDREALALAAGDRLRDADGGGSIVRDRVAPEAVGQWRRGVLSFENAPLARVAAEIEVTSGMRLTVAPALAGRTFTGTIALRGSGETLARRIGPLLGTAAVRKGAGWELVPAARLQAP